MKVLSIVLRIVGAIVALLGLVPAALIAWAALISIKAPSPDLPGLGESYVFVAVSILLPIGGVGVAVALAGMLVAKMASLDSTRRDSEDADLTSNGATDGQRS